MNFLLYNFTVFGKNTRMKIIDRTKLFLEAEDMTQLELARHLGVAFTSLNRLLNGKAGKASLALKLDAFLDAHGFYPQKQATPSTAKEEG